MLVLSRPSSLHSFATTTLRQSATCSRSSSREWRRHHHHHNLPAEKRRRNDVSQTVAKTPRMACIASGRRKRQSALKALPFVRRRFLSFVVCAFSRNFHSILAFAPGFAPGVALGSQTRAPRFARGRKRGGRIRRGRRARVPITLGNRNKDTGALGSFPASCSFAKLSARARRESNTSLYSIQQLFAKDRHMCRIKSKSPGQECV